MEFIKWNKFQMHYSEYLINFSFHCRDCIIFYILAYVDSHLSYFYNLFMLHGSFNHANKKTFTMTFNSVIDHQLKVENYLIPKNFSWGKKILVRNVFRHCVVCINSKLLLLQMSTISKSSIGWKCNVISMFLVLLNYR